MLQARANDLMALLLKAIRMKSKLLLGTKFGACWGQREPEQSDGRLEKNGKWKKVLK